MTADLDATLDRLERGYLAALAQRPLNQHRGDLLDQGRAALERGDLAAALALTKRVWESWAVMPVCEWMAAPLVPCVPDAEGWCDICTSLMLGVRT